MDLSGLNFNLQFKRLIGDIAERRGLTVEALIAEWLFERLLIEQSVKSAAEQPRVNGKFAKQALSSGTALPVVPKKRRAPKSKRGKSRRAPDPKDYDPSTCPPLPQKSNRSHKKKPPAAMVSDTERTTI